jgi:ribosomal protein L37AE/L43A
MDCPKCQGLMQMERFSDFFLVFYAWKCLNCGAIIDRTISMNRKNSLAAKAMKETVREIEPAAAA